MNIDIIEKDAFFVIGYDDSGPIETAKDWIMPLWEQFNADFAKLAPIAKKDAHGRYLVWGAMTDVGQDFHPWTDEGRYMAGVESDRYMDAEGFAVWRIPAFRYLRAEATLATYADVYREVLGTLFPNNGWELVGAVQEFYRKDQLYLFFPIERL